jgi:hypothetical protein
VKIGITLGVFYTSIKNRLFSVPPSELYFKNICILQIVKTFKAGQKSAKRFKYLY